MRKQIYSKTKIARHVKWHKGYNHLHTYSTKETHRTGYTWAEMYLIWNRKLNVKGARELSDIEIAKFLKRSLQAIQLKRHKMKIGK